MLCSIVGPSLHIGGLGGGIQLTHQDGEGQGRLIFPHHGVLFTVMTTGRLRKLAGKVHVASGENQARFMSIPCRETCAGVCVIIIKLVRVAVVGSCAITYIVFCDLHSLHCSVCLSVGLLVCLLFIGHTTFVHFAALPPSGRESRISRRRERPRARGQAHAQREHARACRTTSQRKNRCADAFQKQIRTCARMLSYT